MDEAKKPSYKYCLVPKCKNTVRSTPDKVFFPIPRNAKVRKQWCKIMERDKVSARSCLYCCEDHFNVKEDTANFVKYTIMKNQGEKINLRLKKGVVPHIFIYNKRDMPPPVERKGAIKRQKSAMVNKGLSEFPMKSSNEVRPSTSHTKVCDVSQAGSSTSRIEVSVDFEAAPSTSYTEVRNGNQVGPSSQVNIEKMHRRTPLDVNVNIKTEKQDPSSQNMGTSVETAVTAVSETKLFTDNPVDGTSISSDSSMESADEPCSSEASFMLYDAEDEKHFFNIMRACMLTAIFKEPRMLLGLPRRSYYLVKLLSENIPLPTIDILVTLKKIKLNESFRMLALQFGYAESSTVSGIFSRSIHLIAAKMKDLIVWPTPLDIQKNLPKLFRRKYANVVSIIDCLEIQVEKTSDTVHQTLPCSQYKKCDTLKYLISYTPDGLVNFTSKGYCEKTSDVMIVQNCDYLQCLPPNTAVMADRGFKDLPCLLEAKKCTLIRTPSVPKSTPRTKDKVKQAKKIAAFRIHVERVINKLRKFHILLPHAYVDHNLIRIMDQVVIVACGLINVKNVLPDKKMNEYLHLFYLNYFFLLRT